MNTQECCLQGCYSVSSDSFNFVYAVSLKMEPGKKLALESLLDHNDEVENFL